MSTRRRRRLAACVVLGLVLVGCTRPSGVDGDARTAEEAHAPEAGELRIKLEELVGLHAHLVAEAGRASGRPKDAAGAALAQSAEDVAAAVTEAAGVDGDDASALERAWGAYVATVVEPGKGAGERRRSQARVARKLATQLAAVTSTLEQQGVRRLLSEPLDKLGRHADAFAKRDHDEAYELEREAYADMVTLGGAVAAGIIEGDRDRYPGPRSTGAIELHSALRQLFGEHALLTATTTRRGVVAARDFPAAAAALNGNTADLSKAVESIYDDASAFTAQWRDRIRLFAEHAAALGDGRKEDANRARGRIVRVSGRLAAMLERVSDGGIAGDDSTRVLRQLDRALLAHTEDFAAKRFDDAERAKQRAYGSAGILAEVIAAAVAQQQPDAYPSR